MAFLGEECHLSEFGVGQHQIKAKKLRRKSISVSQTVCPTCSLQVNAGICMPIHPLEQLWICKLNSFLLLWSQSLLPHEQSPPSLTPLQRRGPHNSDTVDLEKLIQLCCIYSLCQVCSMCSE